MSQQPEQPPLRASDADREAAAGRLSEALVEGRLDATEHAERLDAVYRAKTQAELVPITADLPAAAAGPAASSAAGREPARSDVVQPAGADPAADRLVAIFGGGERKGRWRVRRRTRAIAVFGGHDLDMTEATFDGPQADFHCSIAFGGLDIKVPPGVAVRNHVAGIFGGVSVKADPDPGPAAPTLVLRGFAIFGGINVEVPRRLRRELER